MQIKPENRRRDLSDAMGSLIQTNNRSNSNLKPLSIYIHIPFCQSKCAYCDFVSFPGRQDAWEAYFAALSQEIAEASDADYLVKTVFFGGGTPSLVPPEWIGKALLSVRCAFQMAEDAEISLEANPGTLTKEKLAAYLAMGVNRLSIGVQSFDAGLLKAVGRIHTPEEAEEALLLSRSAGFENISLDLMYALPGQTMDMWKNTLAHAIALAPDHISAYSLIVEEGTPIAARRQELPGEEQVIEMQRMATRLLLDAGYGRYEISNYAKSDRACQHNIVYWRCGEYLGFGCAAHSFYRDARFENSANLDGYMQGDRRQNRTVIDQEEAQEEMLLLSTRMCEGLSLSKYRNKFGIDFQQGRNKMLHTLAEGGLIAVEHGFVRLTERGLEVQNAVVLALLDSEA